MENLGVIELVAAFFVFVILIGQFINNERTKSLKFIKILLVLSIVWLLSDGLSLVLNGPETPESFLYFLFLLSYLMSPIFAVVLGFYADVYIRERGPVSRWWFTVPSILQICGVSVYLISFIRGDLGTFVDGTFVYADSIPVMALVLFLGFLAYAPIICFFLHKKIGYKPGVTMVAFLLPISVSIVYLKISSQDFTILATALSTLLLVNTLENDITKMYLRDSLVAENNDKILALEDDFESLYDVDLETLNYELFSREQAHSDYINKGGFSQKTNFIDDSIANIKAIAHPDDIEEFIKIMNVEYIQKVLEYNDHIDHYIRLLIDGKQYWRRIRIVYRNKFKDHLIIGIFNAQEQMEKREQDEKIRKQLIENMLNEDAVFLVNIDDDSRTTLHNHTIDKDEYSDTERFSSSIGRYIDNTIVPYDRRKARQMLSLDYMREHLQVVPEYSFKYRETSSGVQRFFEMKIAKLSDSEVLISATQRDREFFDNLVFDSIKNDYFAMFVVDTDEELVRVLKDGSHSGFVKEGDILSSTKIFDELSKQFGQDESTGRHFEMLKDSNFLKNKFLNQERSSFIFKMPDVADKWIAVTEFVLSRHHQSKDPAFIAVGFSFLDKEASENAILQKRLEEDMGLIGGLAQEYQALFYFNINDGNFKIYSLADEIAPFANRFLKNKKNGIDALKAFGTSPLVHKDDRALFNELSTDFVIQKLSKSKRFSIRYRRRTRDDFDWFEMHFIKNEPIDERANVIIIGFSECGGEIRKEQVLQKSFNLLSGDIASYDAVNELLSYMGEYYGGDRVYVCETLKTKEFSKTTYEWTENASIPSIKHVEVPVSVIQSWLDKLALGNTLVVKTEDEINSDEIRNNLSSMNVSEMILAPMINNGEIAGFIGVNNPTKTIDDLETLKTVSTIVYSEILRRKEGDEEHVTLEKVTSSFVSVFFADLNRDYAHNWKLSQEHRYRDADLAVSKYSVSFREYVNNCVDPSDRERVLKEISEENILEQFKTKSIFSIDLKDISLGKVTNLVFDFIKVSDDGTRFVISSRDITEAIEKEQEQNAILQAALEQADSANKSKTNFLFNMSHDIRTPMNAIQGFTDMAIKYIDNKEKALDCLKKTQQSGTMLLSLINSVLEVSRIESGHAVLQETPTDITHSFASIETTMNELANINNISLNFKFGNIKNGIIICDRSRCTRIMVNIISNAIKYTKAGGKVDVLIEQLCDPIDGVADYIFKVSDNGIGMSEEFQKHVFEQFSREKTSTVSGIQGTGLGMSVVKSFVDLMDGKIVCESKLGVGTTFTVTVPFKVQIDESEKDVNNSSTGEEKTISLNNRRVLLVDDNALNREIAAEILQDSGMIVETAFDGSMAVNTIKEKGEEYYDFVLMDIQMPIMNGYEATREIRKLFPNGKLPIIALSANAFVEDKLASIEAGMNDHVAKPINTKELMKTMAKYL